jgi:hypothetical protein
MNSATDKSSLDRTLGASKPVDPATRLSELLAQSLEELTRPFDPPRPAPLRAAGEGASSDAPAEEPASEQTPEESRLDADKALAELEAELFAAAKQVDREAPARDAEPAPDHMETPPADEAVAMQESDIADKAEDAPNESDIAPPPLVPEEEPKLDPDAVNVVAKVRKLMLVSMAVTIIAVGSVFGLIGYRIFKSEAATTAKTADKLPEASAIPADMTLALPRGARVIQSAVAGDRLVITLETDGKIEVRTFDVNTLQPAGRLNFSGTP